MSKDRLHQQREIKRKQNQQLIMTMTKREVAEKRLESFVFHPLGVDMTPFNQWWKPLDDEALVEVRYPHEQHGLAGCPSNHSKTEVRNDFLEFVDHNSQPNGRDAGSHNARISFCPSSQG